MSDPAAGKSGPHRSRSKSLHKVHGRGSQAGLHGAGGRRMTHRHRSSVAHHGSGGLIGSAEADLDVLARRASTKLGHAKHHHASGARRSLAQEPRKSLADILPTTRKEVIAPSAMRGYSLLALLKAACSTDDCRTAVAMVNTSIDPSANPCDDLYKYVCGNWHVVDDDGKPLSYEANVKYHYVSTVDSNLVGNATTQTLCSSDDPRAKMGCVYTSCVTFYTKKRSSLQFLLTVAKIDPKAWMHAKDFRTLFYLFVRTIVDTGVPSVLHVIKRDSLTAVVEVGACISCSADGDDSLVRNLLSLAVTIKIVDSETVEKLMDNFVHLDKLLKNIPTVPKGTPAVEADKSLFEGADRYTWEKALSGSHAGFSNKTEELKLVSPNSMGAGKVVSELRSASLEVARLYTLLAPVAPFVALERSEAGLRPSMTTLAARAKCLNNVAFLFPIPFDTAVASFLGAEKATVTFDNLWSSTRLAGVNDLHLGMGLDLSKDALMAASIGVREASGLDDPAFAEKYDGDFLANLLRYLHFGRTQFQASDFRSDSKDKGGFLPTNYFSPDYYYKDATEKPINSGTLGALAAAMLFRLSLPHLVSEPTGYIKCLTEYSRNSLKIKANESDWLTYTRARWAISVALATARQGANPRYHRELGAMHYLRAARGYCGEEEKDRAPLKFTARSSPDFNETFECNYPYPPMSC
ncbi:hypothetical protein MTO96_048868 [Rhipicephalus appendiculatus]